MKRAPAASRYAKALFQLAKESGQTEKVLNELRALDGAIEADAQIEAAFNSPLIQTEDLLRAVEKALEGMGISDELGNTFRLLAVKNRLGLFRDIVAAFEIESDTDAGVARGSVKSPAPLDVEERRKIEEFISKITKKKAILEYRQSPELIGGLVAQVGSFTFDDSLDTQLDLLRGHLNRRTH